MDKDTRKPPTHVTVNTPGEEEKRTAETPETSPGPAPSGCHRFGNPGLYYGRFGVESFPSGAGKQ